MLDTLQPGYPYPGWSVRELRYWAEGADRVMGEIQARLVESVEAAAGSVADAAIRGKKAKGPGALRKWLKKLRGSDG